MTVFWVFAFGKICGKTVSSSNAFTQSTFKIFKNAKTVIGSSCSKPCLVKVKLKAHKWDLQSST